MIDKSAPFPWVLNPEPALCGLLPWTVLGCLGAVLGSELKKRTAKRITRLRRSIRLAKSRV